MLGLDAALIRSRDGFVVRLVVNRGGDLVLVRPQPSVARMLELLCVEDMFTICSDTGTAQQAR